MDQNGYILSGISFLLIIPVVYLIISFVDMEKTGSQSQELQIQSDVVFLTERDIENNLPIISENIFQSTSNEVVKSGNPIPNSGKTIKNRLQSNLDDFTKKYMDEGINATCTVISVFPGQNPFNVEINSLITIKKDDVANKVYLSQNISITDPNYPIPDPLPFIKCKRFGVVKNTSTRIIYGESLKNYLKNEKMHNANIYINATSPLNFKKCIYEPYNIHGQSYKLTNLRNCIENGFYHESSDGSCFLCRLEGRGTCSHYGLETFIIPPVSNYEGSVNAPCSSDHVIFSGHYEGHSFIYHSNTSGYFKIFLDNGHHLKYGLA